MPQITLKVFRVRAEYLVTEFTQGGNIQQVRKQYDTNIGAESVEQAAAMLQQTAAQAVGIQGTLLDILSISELHYCTPSVVWIQHTQTQ